MDNGGAKTSLIIHPADLKNAKTLPTLFLVRHAESTGNLRARLQGSRIGGALSDRGQKQSEATAKYLADTFDELRGGNVRLGSSPSSRVLQTAAPIAQRLACETHVEPDLAELDFGEWSGMLVEHLESHDAYQHWKDDPWSYAPPGGELLSDVQKRAGRAVSQLLSSAAIAGQSLVVVTHFFPLLALFDALVSRRVRCDNASISRFEPKDGWTLTHINKVSHLSDIAPIRVRYV